MGRRVSRASLASSRLRSVSPCRKFWCSSTYTASRPEPRCVVAQQRAGRVEPGCQGQPRHGAVAPAGEQHQPLGVVGQVCRVQPGFAAVDAVGEGEEAREVGVTRARLRQQHDPRAVGQGQLAAGDGLHAEAAGQPRELQRPAQIGVRQREGRGAVLRRLRQQLVDVGRAQAEGVEALGVQFDVASRHGTTLAMRFAGTSNRRAGRGTG